MRSKEYFSFLLLVFSLLILFSCASNQTRSKEIVVFKNDGTSSGYGYDILINGKVSVHQPNIPAVQGNTGFSSEEAAYKTAELVLYKIKHNILPPSVDVKELDSLDALQ